jgi:hypothetical protein
MKKFLLVCAALVLVAGLVGTVSAAEKTVAANTLSDLGLAGMTVMSDTDGLAIRGKGCQQISHCAPKCAPKCEPRCAPKCEPKCQPKCPPPCKPVCRPNPCNPCKIVCAPKCGPRGA